MGTLPPTLFELPRTSRFAHPTAVFDQMRRSAQNDRYAPFGVSPPSAVHLSGSGLCPISARP